MAGPGLAKMKAALELQRVSLPPQRVISNLISEDSAFLRSGSSSLSTTQIKALRSLFKTLGIKISSKALADFTKGKRQQAAGVFRRLPALGKDARKNLLLFLKKYNLKVTDQKTLNAFIYGQSFVLGGKTGKSITAKDIEKMKKTGIYVSVNKSGECYFRTKAGQLIQNLANSGILLAVKPDKTVALINNLRFPASLKQNPKLRTQLIKALQRAAALSKAGKHTEAFYIHNLFLNVVSAYQQMDALHSMKRSAQRADVNIKDRDFGYLIKSSKIGLAGFRKVFGVSYKDFLRLGSIGGFAVYKIAAAQHELNNSVKVWSQLINGLIKPKLNSSQAKALFMQWKKQSKLQSLPARLLVEAQSATSVCLLVNQNRSTYVQWRKSAAGGDIKGKIAKELIRKKARATEAKVRKYFWAIEGELKKMLFFTFAGSHAAIGRNITARQYSGARIARLQNNIASFQAKIKQKSASLKSLIEMTNGFESYVLAQLDKIKQIKARSQKKNGLNAFEKKIIRNLRAGLINDLLQKHGIFVPVKKGADTWDLIHTTLAKHILNNYNPKSAISIDAQGNFEFNKNDKIGSLCISSISSIQLMHRMTWRLEQNKAQAKSMALRSMRKLHTYLKARSPAKYKLLQGPLLALTKLADKLATGKISVTHAGKQFQRIIESYGNNMFVSVTGEAQTKLREIKRFLKKERGAYLPEAQQNLVRLLFRKFIPEDLAKAKFRHLIPKGVLSIDAATYILENVRYKPDSFFNMYGVRAGERFLKDDNRLALYVADLVDVAYSMCYVGKYTKKMLGGVLSRKAYPVYKSMKFTYWEKAELGSFAPYADKIAPGLLKDSRRAFEIIQKMIPKKRKKEFTWLINEYKKLDKSKLTTRKKVYKLASLYSTFSKKLNDVIDDVSFEQATQGMKWYKRYGYKTLRFMEKNLDTIMTVAFVGGVVLGAFTSAGTASAPAGLAGRKLVWLGVRKILTKSGWRAIYKKGLKHVLRSGMAGVSIAGKGIFVASAVPMLAGLTSYAKGKRISLKDEKRALERTRLLREGRDLFDRGIGYAFLGLLSSYGPLAASRRVAPWLRATSVFSEYSLIGATGLRIAMVTDTYREGNKIAAKMKKEGATPAQIAKMKKDYTPGALELTMMGMDMLFVGLGTYRLYKTLRGPMLARAAGKATGAIEVSEKILKGDIFLLGMYSMEPFIANLILPEAAKKEYAQQMLPTKHGLPKMYPREIDYEKMGIIPEEIQYPILTVINHTKKLDAEQKRRKLEQAAKRRTAK